MCNLFGAMQINSWVKHNFDNYDNLINTMRYLGEDGYEGLSNKVIFRVYCFVFFTAGFIVWVSAFRGED